jgi:hypothetical protein
MPESKSGPEARRFDEAVALELVALKFVALEFVAPGAGCPGGARLHPGLKSLLGLLGLLCLLRLFRLLRFLSHNILFWFNGRKRDTRHARRRASLTTSSNPIPTDSQAAAPHCHADVITLSTVVMGFDAGFTGAMRPASRENLRAPGANAPSGLTTRQPASASCTDPEQPRASPPRVHQFKTTVWIAPSR